MKNEGLYERIQEAAAELGKLTGASPSVGIISGTHLEGLIESIQVETSVPYSEVPHFPHGDTPGKDESLLFGSAGGKPVVATGARLHLYEGYTSAEAAFPVRVMKALGANVLLVFDAVCSLNPSIRPAELALIEDHINLQCENPLLGSNDERIGPRFPDMSAPYSRHLNELALKLAGEERIPLHNGVYAAVAGLDVVTDAEFRFMRGIGADVVGMGTVPEVIAAVHQGMEVMAISVVTSPCISDPHELADTGEVTEAAVGAIPCLVRLMMRVIEEL